MVESTIETCPKHGIQFNRAHYRECELCRGPLTTTLQVESPLSAEWMKRLKIAGAVLAFALVAYIGVALTSTQHAPERSYAGSEIVGMPCVRTCADRSDECLVDCASVRMDGCEDQCMPEMERCANRCRPQLAAGEGITMIRSEVASPRLDGVLQGIYASWPADDKPDHAFVRLTINRNTGTVHSAQVQSRPARLAEAVAGTFKRAVFPKAADPRDGEPGRHDALAPYVVYVVMTL